MAYAELGCRSQLNSVPVAARHARKSTAMLDKIELSNDAMTDLFRPDVVGNGVL
jgi:hypothetical protein